MFSNMMIITIILKPNSWFNNTDYFKFDNQKIIKNYFLVNFKKVKIIENICLNHYQVVKIF